MITRNDIETLPGTNVIDSDGDKVGDVGQVYVSDDGSEPLFVTVKTGLFGLKESFIPLQGASLTEDGLRVGFDKQVIKDAPRVDADQQISEDEQSTLFDYYEQRGTSSSTGSTTGTTGATGADTRRDDTDAASDRDITSTDRDVDDRDRAGVDDVTATSPTVTVPASTTSPRVLRGSAPRAPPATRTPAAPSATTPAAPPPTTP